MKYIAECQKRVISLKNIKAIKPETSQDWTSFPMSVLSVYVLKYKKTTKG